MKTQNKTKTPPKTLFFLFFLFFFFQHKKVEDKKQAIVFTESSPRLIQSLGRNVCGAMLWLDVVAQYRGKSCHIVRFFNVLLLPFTKGQRPIN